jgi:hypothetical protein
MENLNESLYHLHYLAQHIEHYFEGIEKATNVEDVGFRNIVRSASQSMIIILIKSMRDEHILAVKKAEQNDEFKDFLPFDNAVQPILEAINNVWPDLRHFRNNILAHNLRNRAGEGKLKFLHTYKIPNSIIDLIALLDLIVLYKSTLKIYFDDRIDDHQDWLDEVRAEKIPPAFNSIEDGKAFTKSVQEEVDRRIRSRI